MSSARVEAAAGRRCRWAPWDQIARGLILRRLKSLQHGQIVIRDDRGDAVVGGPGSLCPTCQVHRPRLFRRALWGGTLAVAESYIQGDWDCDDLAVLLRIFARNIDQADRLDAGLVRLAGLAQRLLHRLRANSRAGSRRNIRAHYDLGNDFFRLWLDDTLAYSSGIFLSPEVTLQEASREKFDRICRKLDLQATDRVLEIGSGWGGFALHAAASYGCHVTTTTISQQQFETVARRVADLELDDQVRLLKQDYRDLDGRFDKLASIEMLEAVGHRYLDAYFRQCGRLLHPEGSLVLQTIVMPERRHARYLRSVDFIRRYIFPGGCLPSLGSILDSVGRTTDLRLVHAEDLAPHYAETARRWRRAFEQRRPEIQALGYSPEFVRLWTYYLCYCEAVFEERHIGILQLQFDKPRCRRDALRQDAAAPRKHEGRFVVSRREHGKSDATLGPCGAT